MSGQGDELKGRIKEAAGDLTDDDKLKHEGKVDKNAGKVKQTAENVKDWVGDKVDDVADRAKRS